MSNKPCIIFNPDFNKIVLDPSTNRLITKGELARKTTNPTPAPVSNKPTAPAPTKPVVKVADKPITVAKPTVKVVDKPVSVAKPAAPVPTKPVVKVVDKPVSAAKSAAPASTKPLAKEVRKEVRFDISASLNPHIPKPSINKGPLIIPSRGGYGAVILGRGRR